MQMRVAPKALIRRMTPTATRLLEAAVGKAATGGFYEITVEHLLAAMLEPDEGDVARVFHNWNVDRKRLFGRVAKDLQRQRTGNTGRPVIPELVFSWLEDAWLTASVDLGATHLRTGHLLLQLVARPDRYTSEAYPELGELETDALKKDLETVLAPSPESSEAVPFAAPAAPAGPS